MKQAATYQPLAYADVPGWESDDHGAAFRAFLKSCDRVLAAARGRIVPDGKPQPAPPPPGLVAACTEAGRLAQEGNVDARAFFERHFTPNAVRHAGAAGLVTGYYEPLLEGSRTPQAEFRTPLYKRPPDLVNLIDETDRASVGRALTHARKTDKGYEPYATRAAIEQGALQGRNLELLYLADPVEAFFLHIQGSGRVKLTDGSMIRVHYDGKNGHPYSSIGRYLIDKGLFAADKMSMGALKRWLKADPERAKQVMWQNASFVFFRELAGSEARAPMGAMQAPLTAGRSLAVDPAYHALGLPVFVTAADMRHVDRATGAFRRLMIAQDVGSAIKGPERGDIFFGSGRAAGRLAGATKHPARFVVLLPNEASARGEAVRGSGAPAKARQ